MAENEIIRELEAALAYGREQINLFQAKQSHRGLQRTLQQFQATAQKWAPHSETLTQACKTHDDMIAHLKTFMHATGDHQRVQALFQQHNGDLGNLLPLMYQFCFERITQSLSMVLKNRLPTWQRDMVRELRQATTLAEAQRRHGNRHGDHGHTGLQESLRIYSAAAKRWKEGLLQDAKPRLDEAFNLHQHLVGHLHQFMVEGAHGVSEKEEQISNLFFKCDGDMSLALTEMYRLCFENILAALRGLGRRTPNVTPTTTPAAAGGGGRGRGRGGGSDVSSSSSSFNPDFLDRHWDGPSPTSPSFSVLSWNVQAAGTRRSAPGVSTRYDPRDRSYLELALRAINDVDQKRVLGLKGGHHPDLVFLQELQTSRGRAHHASWADTEMKRKGYNGHYHNGRKNTVGLYWREDLFRPVGNPTFEQFSTGKPCILQLLTHKRTNKTLLAVSIHLSVPLTDGNPDDGKCCREVDEMIIACKKKTRTQPSGSVHSMLVAGDTNAKPGTSVYRKLTEQYRGTSAYKTVCGKEPRYTSVKPEFRETIDYIFSWGIVASSVLGVKTPWHDVAHESHLSPSDHLPIVARFELGGGGGGGGGGGEDKAKPPALFRQITGKDGHHEIAAAIGHRNEQRELIFQLLEQVSERFRRGAIIKEQKVILKDLIIASEFEKVKLVLEIFP